MLPSYTGIQVLLFLHFLAFIFNPSLLYSRGTSSIFSHFWNGQSCSRYDVHRNLHGQYRKAKHKFVLSSTLSPDPQDMTYQNCCYILQKGLLHFRKLTACFSFWPGSSSSFFPLLSHGETELESVACADGSFSAPLAAVSPSTLWQFSGHPLIWW